MTKIAWNLFVVKDPLQIYFFFDLVASDDESSSEKFHSHHDKLTQICDLMSWTHFHHSQGDSRIEIQPLNYVFVYESRQQKKWEEFSDIDHSNDDDK